VVIDWNKRHTTRAAVLVTIETVLDQLPRIFTPDVYKHKCELVFQHVFDSYGDQGRSLYDSPN
jgi:type I restriction enzyme R subunit